MSDQCRQQESESFPKKCEQNLFFPFHYNTSSELDEIPLKGNALGGEYTKCLRGTKRDIVILSTMDSMAAAGSYKHIRERQ